MRNSDQNESAVRRTVGNLRRTTVFEVVTDRIKQHIIEGKLQPGDRLPTVQDFADRIGVSRVSVREATRALSFMGIIRAAPKRGLTVGEIDIERATNLLGFHFAIKDYPRSQLLRARLVLELGSLPYVVERFDEEPWVYEKLLSMVEAMDPSGDPEVYLEQDIAFHRELMEAGGIEPLVAVSDLLRAFFDRFHHEVVTGARARGKEEHRQILQALWEKNLGLAQTALRKHLGAHKV